MEQQGKTIQITPEHAQIMARSTNRRSDDFEELVDVRASKKGRSEFINSSIDLAINYSTVYSSGFAITTISRNLDELVGEHSGLAIIILVCIFLGVSWKALADAWRGDARLVLLLVIMLGGMSTEVYLNKEVKQIERPVILHSPVQN